MHNITHAVDFRAARDGSLNGKLTEEEFVGRWCSIEHETAQEMRAFLVQAYIPWAREKKVTIEPGDWYLTRWGRPEDAIKEYTDKNAYPWQPYSGYYLRLRWHYVISKGDYAEAMSTAERYLKLAVFDDEKADAHCMRAAVCAKRGDIERAKELLRKSAAIAPKGYDDTLLKAVQDLVGERVLER